MQQILKYHGAKGNLVMEDDLDDVSEKFDTISDANDHILEKVVSYWLFLFYSK